MKRTTRLLALLAVLGLASCGLDREDHWAPEPVLEHRPMTGDQLANPGKHLF